MDKTIRTASGGVAEEFRKLEVGETVAFPAAEYNANTIRNAQSSQLLNERLKYGKTWKTRTDIEDRCIYVTRVK